MKKLLVLLSFTCMVITSNAQTPEALKQMTPVQRATLLTDTMRTLLVLNNDQYSTLYEVNLDFAQKAEPVLKSNDSKLSKFSKLKTMQDARENTYKTILTSDQFKLYQSKKDELIAQMKQKYK